MKKTGNCSLKADALFLERRYSEAEVLYRLAYEASPMNAHVLCNLATTLMQMGQLEEAERFFALSIQIDSENPAVINNYATLLFRLGKHEEGLKNLTYLAKRCPDDLEALTNIGVACNRFFQHESAKEWFLRALKIDENFADAHLGLAAALGNLGFHEECRQHARRAAELGPDLPGPRLLLCMSVLPLVASSDEEDSRSKDLFKAAVEDLRAWASISNRRLSSLGELIGDRQPFALAYRSGNLLPLLKEYGDIASISAKSYWSSRGEGIFIVPPQRKRIRISILNEQIRRHSVWDIILRGIVKNLDRSIFEVVLYHTGGYIDGETKWAESVADRFVQGPKGHAEWLRIIREDAPDILFLPEIGMDPLTCKLAALRLAPLQVASWGHPVTTGFQDIDLFFSGELIEGDDAQSHYREKLICLPGTGACTEPLNFVDEPLPSFVSLPLDRNIVRFVICQRPFKVTPSDDASLVKIIRSSSPCKIYLLRDTQYPWASIALKVRLETALVAEGLSPEECLVEIPWLKREQFYSLLDQMDIYLDMPAFSGYTTAWQAVHRGIPVVTLEGRFMRQRLAAGLLRKIGNIDTIAQTEDEYVEIAVRLADECRDPERFRARRASIKAAAPKADHDVSVVRAFENVLIEELSSRGRNFEFSAMSHVSSDDTAESQAIFQEGYMVDSKQSIEVYPWQLLNTDLHLHTLKPDYAPVGLLEMITPLTAEKPCFRVLDVGCFCGGSGLWIKKKFPNAEIIGIEMLEKAAEMAAKKYDKVIVGTFENVDFDAEALHVGTVDAIVAADVLEHLYNPWQALQRLKPLLAPGGAIYISLPNIRNLNILTALAKGQWQYAGAGILDITHIRFFTRQQAIQMLEQTGWKVGEIRINPDPRLMAAFDGKDLSQIQNIEADGLKLTGLSQDDVLEMLALQLFIKAEPV